MSLEATHIRFALDIKEKYQVQDIEKYVSGTIYPDSRYITKIDRELTHNDDILRSEFAKNDFRKGWQVHQICDTIQNKIKKRALPELFLEKYNGYNEQRWVVSTAIKIIQDINDMQQFPIKDCLKYLKFSYNPNGENISDIKKYNKIIINLYKDKTKTTVEDNHKTWLALGIDNELNNKVKEKTKEFLKDKKLVKRIESCYQMILSDYIEVFI